MEVGFTPRRGDIIWADLEKQTGNITYGMRPVLIIGENAGNASSPNVQIIIGTDGKGGEEQNTQVVVPGGQYGLEKDTCFQAEQINTISKQLLRNYMGTLVNTNYLGEIEKAVARVLGLSRFLNEPVPVIPIQHSADVAKEESHIAAIPPLAENVTALPPSDITPPAASVPAEVPAGKLPQTYRGLIHCTCLGCGETFFFSNRENTSIQCRLCGKSNPLSSLVKFSGSCGCCERNMYGWTNASSGEIEVRCKCGNPLTLKYSQKLNQYTD